MVGFGCVRGFVPGGDQESFTYDSKHQEVFMKHQDDSSKFEVQQHRIYNQKQLQRRRCSGCHSSECMSAHIGKEHVACLITGLQKRWPGYNIIQPQLGELPSGGLLPYF